VILDQIALEDGLFVDRSRRQFLVELVVDNTVPLVSRLGRLFYFRNDCGDYTETLGYEN
jgi:hypothetical protein